MTLTIHTQEDERRQLEMTIEIDEGRIQRELRKLARDLSRRVHVPGFRTGKVPYRVIAKRFGEDNMRRQIIEEMLNDVLMEALEQEEIRPYARPTLNDMQLKPAVLDLTVPLTPVVELGDYRSIRKEIETPEVTEEAVDEALQRIRERHQVTESVDRPSQEEDLIKLIGKGVLLPQVELTAEEAAGDDVAEEDVIFDNKEGLEFLLDPEKTFVGTDFVDNLVGLSLGDEKEFTITFPEDYELEDYAGREAEFSVFILEVNRRDLPELDDDLAKEEGDYETLEELRAAERERLQMEAEEQARSDFFDEMVDALLEEAELIYPPAAVTEELDARVENLKQQVESYGWEWEEYLNTQNETVDSLHAQWRESATQGVERSLVLQEFIRREKLTVSPDEIDAAVDERMERFAEMDAETRALMRQMMTDEDGRQRMGSEILFDKVHERLVTIVTGDAPDLDALEEEAAAATTAEEETTAETVDEAVEPAVEPPPVPTLAIDNTVAAGIEPDTGEEAAADTPAEETAAAEAAGAGTDVETEEEKQETDA